jgi:hypothetical protein
MQINKGYIPDASVFVSLSYMGQVSHLILFLFFYLNQAGIIFVRNNGMRLTRQQPESQHFAGVAMKTPNLKSVLFVTVNAAEAKRK